MSTGRGPSILMIALSAAACGGSLESADFPQVEEGEASASVQLAEPDATRSGSCSAVCTEVVACCICKCYADLDGPFAYACAVGCFVLDTVSLEDHDAVITFADRRGAVVEPLSEALVVDRSRGSIDVEVGGYVLEQRSVRAVGGVVDVSWHVIHARSTTAVRPWSPVGGQTVVTPEGTHRTTLALGGLAPDDYVLRATLALADGTSHEARAMLVVR